MQTAPSNENRKLLMLDQTVQGALMGRVVWHWGLCLASTTLAAWVWSVWSDPQPVAPIDILRRLGPALVGSLLVLPLALADMLRTSNRFVGPVLRLRNAMKRAMLGDDVEPLESRRGDYWKDLIERFNQLQQKRNSGTAR